MSKLSKNEDINSGSKSNDHNNPFVDKIILTFVQYLQ